VGLLERRFVTLAALLTWRKIAQAIVYTSGGYIMIAMQNHPRLHDDVATAFGDPAPVAGTHDSGHECTERQSGPLFRAGAYERQRAYAPQTCLRLCTVYAFAPAVYAAVYVRGVSWH
jgi:hypothetical protein